MNNHAVFEVVDHQPTHVTIRDAGHLTAISVTNDVEYVVQRLLGHETLKPGQRLFYYDSQGDFDEIKIENGKFAGFAPAVKP